MTYHDASSTPAILIDEMKAIAQAAPRHRPVLFDAFHARYTGFLKDAAVPPLDRPANWEDFRRRAVIYLRALSTYSPASDEWLGVFRAFRTLTEETLTPPGAEPPLRESLIERLRRNSRITLTEG